MPSDKALSKLVDALYETKFRLVSQGDVLVMRAITATAEPSASQLILTLTVAQNRIMALSQIGPLLKLLQNRGLILTKQTNSHITGRPMIVYRLSRKGERALELAEELIQLVRKSTE
jgi:DNA-binding PadR family transcriptional regulator